MSLYKLLCDCENTITTEQIRKPVSMAKANFNIAARDIFIGDIPIMQKGKIITSYIQNDNALYETCSMTLIERDDLIELGIPDLSKKPYKIIEKLYEIFNDSLDTKTSAVYRGSFAEEVRDAKFKLSYYNKDYARILLEGYVLLASMSGLIPWEKEDQFYWKSKRHPKLIVFKNMIEGKEV